MKKLIRIALLTLVNPSYAQQEFYVTSHSPEKHANSVATTRIQINFNQPIATNSLSDNALIVMGDVSGIYDGAFSFLNENQTLCFTPERAFSAGEHVRVTVNSSIMSSDGQILGKAVSFSFNMATASSSLRFQFLKIIALDNLPAPIQLSSYDLNRDGELDFIVGTNTTPINTEPTRLAILRSSGSTLGEYSIEYVIAGVSTCCFLAAPFDGDQHVDLIALDYLPDVLQFMKGHEDSFESPRPLFNLRDPRWGDIVDCDGDGDIDFAIASLGVPDAQGITIFKNEGDGNFRNTAVLGDNVPTPFLAWEDADNDGRVDLISSTILPNKYDLAIYKGDSLGDFRVASLSVTKDYTCYFQLRDLDTDGDLDAILVEPLFFNPSNGQEGQLEVLMNNGAGSFSSVQELFTHGSFPNFLECRDFDGDGDMDVACTNSGTGQQPDSTVAFFLNDGTGNLTWFQNLKVGRLPVGLRFIDLNQDSRLDLAVVTTQPPALHLFLADTLTSSTSPIPKSHRLTLKINPNPFRETVAIHITAPANTSGELFIYDLLGRQIFSTPVQIREGRESIQWDGRNVNNQKMASGIYLARVRIGSEFVSQKLLLLR
jgi:hypothetical protein